MGLIKEILLANFTNCWKLRPDNAEDNQQLFIIINSSTTIENTSEDGSEQSTSQAYGDGNVENPKGL